MADEMWNAPPEELARALTSAGLRRGFIVPRAAVGSGVGSGGGLTVSHPVLEPLAEAVGADPNYRGHEAVFLAVGEESGHLLSACLHKTNRGQGAGGVRFWRYDSLGSFLRDGLRLSLGMGQKNALAGLWWGGGKGVIARRPDADHRNPAVRRRVYRDYGRFITSLRGCYVTAEDVGTTPADMAEIFATTRHATSIPPEVGGSGNPSVLTAAGVVVGMEAALDFLGLGDLEGKTVAVQGLGQVSSYIIGELLERRVGRVIGVDIDEERVETVRRAFPEAPLELSVTAPEDLSFFATECDVLAPSAVGAVLGPETIPMLRAPVVCGAANNQLAEARRDGRALAERGILYAPDFLVNRMGIVNCANEQYGVFPGDPAIVAHLCRDTPHGVFQRAQEVFRRARAAGTSTAEEAEALADTLMEEPHPLWPNRGRQIIDHLVSSDWARGG